MFQRIKLAFKAPIDKEDLGAVLLNGFLTSLLFGAILGIIDYFTVSFFQTLFLPFMILISLALIYRGREAIVKYHVWYSIILSLFFIFGYWVSNIIFLTLVNNIGYAFRFKNFSQSFEFLWIFSKRFYTVGNVLNLIAFIASIVLIFIYLKKGKER